MGRDSHDRLCVLNQIWKPFAALQLFVKTTESKSFRLSAALMRDNRHAYTYLRRLAEVQFCRKLSA